MKDFIVLCGIILLLLAFPLQSMIDVSNDYKLTRFDEIVYRSTQTARTDGYFTPDNIQELTDNITDAFPGISPEDIIINVETSPKYRTDVFDEREFIHYEIGIPIDKIIALNKLFGISDEDNKGMYIKKGYVLSEVLP